MITVNIERIEHTDRRTDTRWRDRQSTSV